MGNINQIELPNNQTYDIEDTTARNTFAQYRRLDDPNYDTINVTELNSGNIINTGAARFLNPINGVCTDGTSETTKYMRQDGVWAVPPNTTYTLSADTTNDKITLTPSSGTAQSITVPYATNAGSATQDGDGNAINTTYLKLAGGIMTGTLIAKPSQYEDSYSGALNMSNSNIYGVNSIYTADSAGGASEGIHFYRDATHVDTLWVNDGDLLFVPNRELGVTTSKANSQKVGRFTANPTSGQVVITDGTTGGMKSSGYTIAKSVPSDAVFTDTDHTYNLTSTNDSLQIVTGTSGNNTIWDVSVVKVNGHTVNEDVPSDAVFTDQNVKQSSTTTSDWRKIVLSHQNDASAGTAVTTDTNTVYVTPNAEIQPSTGTIRSAGNITATIFGVSASGTSGGISLYSGAGNVDNYGIAFRKTTDKEKHGYVQSDWATYFTMNSGATTRGWVYRLNQTDGNVASISGAGNLVLNGSVTIGGNTTNTSGARMQYNASTNAIDFVFVA